MNSTETILLTHSHQERVCHLTLNTPHRLNAMTVEMAHAFRLATQEIGRRPHCRAVVIEGAGRAFSAGGDLEMLKRKASLTVEENRREMMWFYRSFLALRELNIPLICLLHGHVVGAGFCFAAACDMRLADDSVSLSSPFTRLALHPGMGGSFFLPRSLGSEVARDLMLTGRRMGAEEALRIGFVSRVCPPGQFEEPLAEILEGIFRGAPEATRSLLATQRGEEEQPLQAALEREAYEQAVCYNRAEFLAGVQALIEKRDPPWVASP